MRKRDYFAVGGVRDLPIMEDVDLVRRARKKSKAAGHTSLRGSFTT
jgi:hypothetical protein